MWFSNFSLVEYLVQQCSSSRAKRFSGCVWFSVLLIGVEFARQLVSLRSWGVYPPPVYASATSIAAASPFIAVAVPKNMRLVRSCWRGWFPGRQLKQIGSPTVARPRVARQSRAEPGITHHFQAQSEAKPSRAKQGQNRGRGRGRGHLGPTRVNGSGTKWPDHLMERLRDVGITKFRPLQEEAFDAIVRGEDVIVHAETGSGKTLCFVMPVLAKMNNSVAPLQGLVLVPTLTLAAQIVNVFDTLQPNSAVMVDPNASQLPLAQVVVGLPRTMLKLLTTDERQRSIDSEAVQHLRTVVFDEADADEMFEQLPRRASLQEQEQRVSRPKPAGKIFKLLRKAHGKDLQALAASATVGRQLRLELGSHGGREFVVIRGPPRQNLAIGNLAFGPELQNQPKIHVESKLPPGIQLKVVTYDGKSETTRFATHPSGRKHSNFANTLVDVIVSEKPTRALYFVREWRSLDDEIELLRTETDFDAKPIREAVWAQKEIAQSKKGLLAGSTSDDGRLELLVAPMSGARGLDVHGVDLVIIGGVPTSRDHFLHMAGRTGRMGNRGLVVLVATTDEWYYQSWELTWMTDIGLNWHDIDIREIDQTVSGGRQGRFGGKPQRYNDGSSGGREQRGRERRDNYASFGARRGRDTGRDAELGRRARYDGRRSGQRVDDEATRGRKPHRTYRDAYRDASRRHNDHADGSGSEAAVGSEWRR